MKRTIYTKLITALLEHGMFRAEHYPQHLVSFLTTNYKSNNMDNLIYMYMEKSAGAHILKNDNFSLLDMI